MDSRPAIYLAGTDLDALTGLAERLPQIELTAFSTLDELTAALGQQQPAALVLDTSLAGAYQAHCAIREDFDTCDIPLLLICSPEEAQAEDFVADDFLPRPLTTAILARKLALLARQIESRQQAESQMRYTQNVAMTAMSSMGELGVVMEFMSKSFACRSIQAVGELALNALGQYDLDGVIQFIWDDETYLARSGNRAISEAERAQFAQWRHFGRLHETEHEFMVNFDHVSIHVLDMPQDAERRGRLRDHIATLCEGVEARVSGLLLEHDNVLKRQAMRFAVYEIRDSVASLYERELAYLHTGRELVGKVIDDFEDIFPRLALMPETERELIDELVTLRQQLSEFWSQPSAVETRLKGVIDALETLAGDVARA